MNNLVSMKDQSYALQLNFRSYPI